MDYARLTFFMLDRPGKEGKNSISMDEKAFLSDVQQALLDVQVTNHLCHAHHSPSWQRVARRSRIAIISCPCPTYVYEIQYYCDALSLSSYAVFALTTSVCLSAGQHV